MPPQLENSLTIIVTVLLSDVANKLLESLSQILALIR